MDFITLVVDPEDSMTKVFDNAADTIIEAEYCQKWYSYLFRKMI